MVCNTPEIGTWTKSTIMRGPLYMKFHEWSLLRRASPSQLNCKNEYLVFVNGAETAAQTIVSYIDWAFRRIKKPRRREMSARGYAS